MDVRVFESRMFSAVTGVEMDTKTLARIGERIWNLRRSIMVKRENRSREEDTIYDPYFEKAIVCEGGGGNANGITGGPVDRAKFEQLKDRYYTLVGWDVKTGRPMRAKLEELGLKDVADKLASVNKLP
jgi:aldehyde:ferredoxin oxidoreductase